MQLLDQPLEFECLHGALAVFRSKADVAQLLVFAHAVRQSGGRFVTLWGSDERDRHPEAVPGQGGFSLQVVFCINAGLALLSVALPADNPEYPDLSQIFPAANRLQRACFDLLGIRAQGGDARSWLRHANWPADYFPLRRDADPQRQFPCVEEPYDFVRVVGDGVHEIPVGPIHAGIIEPGHFRFSIVGEKVLRLEERLGWTHKGIEKRFEQLSLAEGYRLAGRVSGDSTVAYAWAYCLAAESLSGCQTPPRALWLRALWLEAERIANHLGDLGYLGNDAAFAFGLSQFLRLKEDWLRLCGELFGHRYLMDCIVPGGVARDLTLDHETRMLAHCSALEGEVRVLQGIYDEHAGVQDRFVTTGRLAPKLADAFSVSGLVGRASSQAWDLRTQNPIAPYAEFDVRIATHRNGDVAARVIVRFEEIFESLRLIRKILLQLPAGECRVTLPVAHDGAFGVGWIEGWRGDVLVALEAGPAGGIRRCHCHDPSWRAWPALEHAILGNIVPDFPLINKSFNLSYSGADL